MRKIEANVPAAGRGNDTVEIHYQNNLLPDF